MRRNLFGSIIIMIMSVILTGCGNMDSKVEQVIQNQMQEADNKNNQSESAKETEEDRSSEISEELPTEVVTDNNTDDTTSDDPASDSTTSDDTTSDDPASDDFTSDDTIDVDLTKLSSTMVYSEVYNMMYTPEDYIGKTVKMSGMFVAYTNQDQSQFYPAVIIADATACCSQGLEFILEGNPSYPEGYPEMEAEITVVGTFETYEEDGNIFCRLQNARLE